VSRRRAHIGTIVVALIAIGIVVAATRISRRLFETPDSAATSGDRHTAIAAPTAPPPPGVDESRVFEVMSATGKVEAQRGDGWAPIRQGDKLTRSDIVRTSVASGAVLRLAAHWSEQRPQPVVDAGRSVQRLRRFEDERRVVLDQERHHPSGQVTREAAIHEQVPVDLDIAPGRGDQAVEADVEDAGRQQRLGAAVAQEDAVAGRPHPAHGVFVTRWHHSVHRVGAVDVEEDELAPHGAHGWHGPMVARIPSTPDFDRPAGTNRPVKVRRSASVNLSCISTPVDQRPRRKCSRLIGGVPVICSTASVGSAMTLLAMAV